MTNVIKRLVEDRREVVPLLFFSRYFCATSAAFHFILNFPQAFVEGVEGEQSAADAMAAAAG